MKKTPSLVLSISLYASLALSCAPMTTSADDGPLQEVSKSQRSGATEARTFTREEYAAAAAKMNKMVEAGEASQEDVNRRLGEMRRTMKRADGQNRSKVSSEREKMAGVRKRIGIAIESGKITPEQGRARWTAYMESQNKKAPAAAQKRYDSAIADLFRMVEEGEVTADQALQRLKRMRARMEKAESTSGARD
ncbi:MAG: hypothetical protein QF389_00635 [Planctomycetota bacterium]|nr:hypothetical protein [Planctomycetota bacterium]